MQFNFKKLYPFLNDNKNVSGSKMSDAKFTIKTLDITCIRNFAYMS